MAKKLLSVWLSLTILILSCITVTAEQFGAEVRGMFFLKNIVINGEEIVNYNLQYPFFLYYDTTYFPLTEDLGDICGFKSEMDWESRTLKIKKTDPTLTNIRNNYTKNNGEGIYIKKAGDVTVLIEDDKFGLVDSFQKIDMKGAPILVRDNVIFLPLRVMSELEEFDWDIHYDSYFGTCISTGDKPAADYVNQAESSYNKGLVNYIRAKNSSHSVTKTQEMVFLFHRASDAFNVDEKLLIAIAEKESTFRTDAVSRSGAIGMMQIMPATAAGYGIDKSMLYDMKTSIDFGAMYISQRIADYGGDVIKALSAYNQGSGTVSRGSYSTGYANKVVGITGTIDNYLMQNGYSRSA